jgi:hypothetical protein
MTTKQVYSLEGIVTKIDHGENRVSFLITKAGQKYPESPPVSFFGESIDTLPEIDEGDSVLARFTFSDRKTNPGDGREGKPYKDGISITHRRGAVQDDDWVNPAEEGIAASRAFNQPPKPQRAPQPAPKPPGVDGMIWGAVSHDAAALLSNALPKPDIFGEDGLAWPHDEWLDMAADLQTKLTQKLYDRRP